MKQIIMQLFTNEELKIMGISMAVVLFLIMIAMIKDIHDYHKYSKMVLEDEDNNKKKEETIEVKEEVKEVPLVLQEPCEELLFEDEGETIYNEALESDNNSLVNVLEQELAKIENEDPYEDKITQFEIEQENTAIISLKELENVSKNLYENNEDKQYDLDETQPISINEIMKLSLENTSTYEKMEKKENKDFFSQLQERYEQK